MWYRSLLIRQGPVCGRGRRRFCWRPQKKLDFAALSPEEAAEE